MSETHSRLPDPNVLQRRASDPETSVWVGASAGSGKTKVLTDRVLRLMLSGTPPARILCLTFTKAAAAEMAIRVNRTLSAWTTAEDAELDLALHDLNGRRPSEGLRVRARQLFARVVDCPGGLKIQTIHAFCQSLLRRFPLEAGVPPQFEAMDDVAARTLIGQALRESLLAARREPGSPLGQAVLKLSGVLSGEEFAKLTDLLVSERGRLALILDQHSGLEGTLDEVRAALNIFGSETIEAALGAACDETAFDGPGLRAAVVALLAGAKTDVGRGEKLAPWLAADVPARVAGFDDYRAGFFTQKGEPTKSLATKAVAASCPQGLAALETEQTRLALLDERLRALKTADYTAALLRLADALLARYQDLKEGRGSLDFDDLILKTTHLLSGQAPWVLFKLDGGLDHILIDEAQDTNPDQWRVVAALADEFFAGLGARETGEGGGGRTVFAVGDEKQSIFSFQRADPAEFARMRAHFAANVQAAESAWEAVNLDISFRSVAAVLETVDAVFADAGVRDGVLSEAGQVMRHIPFRRGQGGRVELWPPIAAEAVAETEAWSPPLAGGRALPPPAARMAVAIADHIAGWLKNGERLTSRDRPVRAGDILVLVRTRGAFVAELVKALKQRGIPVAGADRMAVATALSVMDLMAVADFLLLPDDDLTLATVLRGPFVNMSEEDLFALAHGRGGRALWPALLARAEEDPAFRPARGWLARLLARTDFIPPYDLFMEILTQSCPADPVSGRRAVTARLGTEALDAVDEFLALAQNFEHMEPPSLQRFIAWLNDSAAVVKRQHEAGADQVRIMTAHGAKGLQAPIVFMPDTMGTPKQSDAVLWPVAGESRAVPLYAPRRGMEAPEAASARQAADHRRDQEYRRLLYVALTRAEDRLIVGGFRGTKAAPDHCWYNLIAAGLRRLGAVEEEDGTLVYAGPQTVPVQKESFTENAAGDLPPLPGWVRARAETVAATARPLTPSKPDADEPALQSPLGRDDGAGFRRGTIIHRLLQSLPDIAEAERAGAGGRYLATCHADLTEVQRSALLNETLAAMALPGIRHLFGPASKAEVPVAGVVRGGVGERVISGQIDRLAVVDGAVWIADYKTNRPPPLTVDQVAAVYLRQMAAYRAALQGIYPGHQVRCVLVWTDGPRVMELPPALLDMAATAL